MDTLSVYAINIQSRSIAERIGCEPTDPISTDIERRNFEAFLRNKAELGINFPNQLDAWNVYDSQSLPEVYTDSELGYFLGSNFHPRDYLSRELENVDAVVDPDEEEIADWVTETKKILMEQAVALGTKQIDVDNIYYSRIHEV